MAPGNFTRVWKKARRKSVAHVDSKTSAISQVLVAVLDGSGWYSFCLICLTDFSTPGLISSSSSSTHCTVALLQDLPQFMFVKKTSEIRENQTSQTLSNHHSLSAVVLICSWTTANDWSRPSFDEGDCVKTSIFENIHNIRCSKIDWHDSAESR